MLKKLSGVLLSLALLVQNIPIFARGFIDVPAEAWYTPYIDSVSEQGIINGYDSLHFGPNDILTRGMMAMILYNKENQPEELYPSSFLDTANTFYDKAASWASSYGYMTGFDNTHFGGDNPITREQLVTVLYRYAKDHYDVIGNLPQSLNLYPDISEISPFAYEAVYWGASEGLIGSNGKLSPKDQTTRAQAAKMFSMIDGIFDKYRESKSADISNVMELTGLNAKITLPEEAQFLYETKYGSWLYSYKTTLYTIRNVLGGRIDIRIMKFTIFDSPEIFTPAFSDVIPAWNDTRSQAQTKIDNYNAQNNDSDNPYKQYVWGGQGENQYCYVSIDSDYFSLYIRNLDTPSTQYLIQYDFIKDGNINIGTEGLKEKYLEITHQITDNVEFY